MCMTHQTHPMSCVMPHPPLHIWVSPHDQSQTTTLLNPYFTLRHCKVVLPVSLVMHNALHSVGECCEMVCKFFVRVLRSTGVKRINHTNVKVALGSRSPFILVLVAVTVLQLNKLRYII